MTAEQNTTVSPKAELPLWAKELIVSYQSNASNQFLLHGNVNDRFLIPNGRSLELGNLHNFLLKVLLSPFDVIFSYDLGNGIRVEKGGELVAEWIKIQGMKELPNAPLEAVAALTHYLRYTANLARLKTSRQQVACLIRDAHLLAPAGEYSAHYELNALALLIRDWASDELLAEHAIATFLVTENINDLHPLLVNNPRAARIKIPLPSPEELLNAFNLVSSKYPEAMQSYASNLPALAEPLAGSSLSAIENLLKIKEYNSQSISPGDLSGLRKSLVEKDCQGLIEFIESKRSLNDIYGQEKIKAWLRQDSILWQKNDIQALPMGYLLCGPVGTGKTFMVECLAGEAGVPVVKFKNFRDRWVGSSESNLERIFRLLHALGRCIVFIDEADQALGKRDNSSGDSNVSGRIYSMMAEEMSNTKNRGKILWILASSRPDLIEVDLKRPGRIDVKIPLFPTTSPEESFQLITALCSRRNLQFPAETFNELKEIIPLLLTPGAAEALAVKIYRLVRTENKQPLEVLKSCLENYQHPIRPEILQSQIQLALLEASDKEFVPDFFVGK